MQTHGGNVFIHVGVSQRCRAPDEEPTPLTLHAESKHTKRSSGALEEGLDRFRMQTHAGCDVFIHVGVHERRRAADAEPSARL